MKLKDLIANIVMPERLNGSDYEEIASTLLGDNRHHYCVDYAKWESRVGSVDLATWLCTDSGVGLVIHYFDRHPVLISFQEARKSSTEYEILDLTKIPDLVEHIKECGEQPSHPDYTEMMEDQDQEMGEGYQVHFACQLWGSVKKVIYKGEVVDLVDSSPRKGQSYVEQTIMIRLSNGDEIRVSLDEVLIPYENQKPLNSGEEVANVAGNETETG